MTAPHFQISESCSSKWFLNACPDIVDYAKDGFSLWRDIVAMTRISA
jgi:hypothetical protein